MAATPQRILLPTDLSPAALAARAFATTLARRLGAELHLLHVRVLPQFVLLGKHERDQVAQLLATGDGAAEEELQREAAASEARAVHPHLVQAMSAAEAIVEVSRSLDCDLIVMGTHGHRGFKHLFLGSVAEAVVRTSPVPVLTVRPGAEVPPAGIREILLAVDFSTPAVLAAGLAAAWATTFDARVSLLHVVEPLVMPEFYALDLTTEGTVVELERRSAEALERFAAHHLPALPSRIVVRSGIAADTIADQAQALGCDLVVLGKRGLNALEHLLLGSVAEKVVRVSAVPVLTARGGA